MLKVALIHDWLTGMRGGERVLEAIVEIFPRSDLFTLLYVPGKISPMLATPTRHTSWLQRVPGAAERYRHFLPLMPQMIERFDLTGFDLVISSSHCVAKGVRKAPGAVHVSYVHAPMRYMWERYEDYFGPGRSSPTVRLAARTLRRRLQEWDRRVSQPDRVDALVANSHFIAGQIERAYGRSAQVIYPFADTARFTAPRKPGSMYLMITAFAPYKRVDIAIEAFNRLKLPLLILGSGQDAGRLRRMAGPTVEFVSGLSDKATADLYAKCRAFIFPGIEDFGITPLEAMSAGAPVIAFGEGGATESVVSGETGLFFRPQTPEALMEAVLRIESGAVAFDEAKCRAQAATFSKTRFQDEFTATVRGAWAAAGKDPVLLDARLAKTWRE